MADRDKAIATGLDRLVQAAKSFADGTPQEEDRYVKPCPLSWANAVEMMGLEPTTPCLQSSRQLAACYAGKMLLDEEHKPAS